MNLGECALNDNRVFVLGDFIYSRFNASDVQVYPLRSVLHTRINFSLRF